MFDAGQCGASRLPINLHPILICRGACVSHLHHSTTQSVDFDRELIARYDGKGPRYTSYPTADRFVPGFGATDHAHALSSVAQGDAAKPLSLYFHIPFCDTVCYYCACNKVITKDRAQADRYLDRLVREIHLQADSLPFRAQVWQLHLGGGTPTFLSDDQFVRLMDAVASRFDLLDGGEFSIEVDPRKVSEETVLLLAGLGFNRMSVGIQDFSAEVQKAVNRVQSEAETRRVIDAARSSNFRSISVDLIYGLPRQSVESVRETIGQVLRIRPDRIALYNYAHLPERFMPQRRINAAELPASEAKLDILQNSIEQIVDAGYVFIGMDHFALPDDELAEAQRRGELHRNFQGYSTHADCDLLALGVSAISKVGTVYCQNVKTLEDYYAKIDSGQLATDRGIALNQDDELRRSVIQKLMCQFELDFCRIGMEFSLNFREYFALELALLEQHARDGLVAIDEEGIRVLPKGRLLIRSVAMVFDRYLREQAPVGRFSRLI
ncbi:oxygen-independent coproporphyrinogen-3 oxidase [Formivibrio citricus]|uniref:Coproporphyrinogen-III oxidase n=1 Tax=Formivibrio citricus TaxID=83765 RepID=A0A1I4XH29_9NEIS|nr:oxygen-independent coproporphyrinogen III oxidase [Formivibrio citricus]SFN25204.1 oxygen-independent coproporphyrinogen-3 oxidase [Formivibrio citricus]